MRSMLFFLGALVAGLAVMTLYLGIPMTLLLEHVFGPRHPLRVAVTGLAVVAVFFGWVVRILRATHRAQKGRWNAHPNR